MGCGWGCWSRAQLTLRFVVRVRGDTRNENCNLVVCKGASKWKHSVSKGFSPKMFPTWAVAAILCWASSDMRTYSSESWLGYFGLKSHPTQCLGYLRPCLHQHTGLGLGERQSTELHLESVLKGATEGMCQLQKHFVSWELVYLGYGWCTWVNS